MKKIIAILIFLTCFNSFAGYPGDSFSLAPSDSETYEKSEKLENLEEILNTAEENASIVGRKILETSRIMISNQEIILGSCWDYIDAIYDRAGYSSDHRVTIFKSKLQGPYVQVDRIESGDWLYFINHSYGDVEHSSVFVAWTNLEKKEALMISYSGGNQSKPARYKIYDLSSVYNIIRPKL